MSEFIVVDPARRDVVDVVLEGGPADLPAELRTNHIDSTRTKIKVEHRGGYEHFERDGPSASDSQPVVFRWTGRTRVAE